MTSRIAFAGTPELAATILGGLLAAKVRPVAVLTQPDRPAGRGRKLRSSPVKTMAREAGIDVLQPTKLKCGEIFATLDALKLDLMVVAAYGLILPQTVLDLPRLGCVNVHASLLPRWRGAAPIQRAIAAGDSQTGITLMQMDAGLDTGAILHVASCPIEPRETGGSLHDKLAELGARELATALPDLLAARLPGRPQGNACSSYAHRLDKSEAAIDWTLPASPIERNVRAFNPWPVAYCDIQVDRGLPPRSPPPPPGAGRLRIWSARALAGTADEVAGTVLASEAGTLRVSAGHGILQIDEVQPAGGKRMNVREFLNARHLPPGVSLGGAKTPSE